ncbi:MAG: hypothetical protein DWQ48_07995 [Bacteroidetes bacterium]|nr:MAG: hypothetical protein DWQ48_07995 [Bacteroidota bacterium]
MVKASGPTSAFQLRTFQGGLWVNPAWVNGGSVTLQNVAASSQLNSPGYNGALHWNATDNLINMTANIGVKTVSSCVSTNVTTAPILVARVRMTNSIPFACTTPDLKFNYVQNTSPLRYRTSVSWRPSGCAVNYDMFYPNRPYTGQALFNGELYTTTDADGRSPINPDANDPSCITTLDLTAYLQGFYLGGQTMDALLFNLGEPGATPDQTDTITVELREVGNTASTYASAQAVLQTNGTAELTFPGDVSGNSYWVVFLHRNSIQTWSKNPVSFTSKTTYNFSTSLNQAFDDGFNPPMQDMGAGVYAIYGGDVNQDGAVDGLDMNDVDNDASIGSFGYNLSDVTGDGATDGLDMNIIDNNSALGIFMATP